MVIFVTGKRRHDFILAVLVVYAEEKIALNDFPRIAAAFFGVAFNMLTFLG
jgi:hypothetical protein